MYNYCYKLCSCFDNLINNDIYKLTSFSYLRNGLSLKYLYVGERGTIQRIKTSGYWLTVEATANVTERAHQRVWPLILPFYELFFKQLIAYDSINVIISAIIFCMIQTAVTTARLTKHMPSSIFHSLCVNAKVGVFTKAEGMTSFLEYAAQRDTPQCHRKWPPPYTCTHMYHLMIDIDNICMVLEHFDGLRALSCIHGYKNKKIIQTNQANL